MIVEKGGAMESLMKGSHSVQFDDCVMVKLEWRDHQLYLGVPVGPEAPIKVILKWVSGFPWEEGRLPCEFLLPELSNKGSVTTPPNQRTNWSSSGIKDLEISFA